MGRMPIGAKLIAVASVIGLFVGFLMSLMLLQFEWWPMGTELELISYMFIAAMIGLLITIFTFTALLKGKVEWFYW